jgi:hypothetical protein
MATANYSGEDKALEERDHGAALRRDVFVEGRDAKTVMMWMIRGRGIIVLHRIKSLNFMVII